MALLLLVAACANTGGGTRGAPSSAPLPGRSDALVLRVASTGGFMGPVWWRAELPRLSIYADGRAISEGPVPAIYPGPALPNLLVRHLDAAAVQDLVDAARAAGVAETGDLGRPPIADAITTRFTLVTASGTSVREVYALGATSPADGLTDEQKAARARLTDLLARLDELTNRSGHDEPYRATAVAVLVRPWTDPQDHLDHAPATWPGPSLPGEPLAARPGTGCVTATGDQARAVLEAAARANELTPWVTADGSRWGLGFRPLLPDETGCADLED